MRSEIKRLICFLVLQMILETSADSYHFVASFYRLASFYELAIPELESAIKKRHYEDNR